MFDDITSVALGSALDGLALRQRTIANNVANMDTPGFHAGRVDFESALKSALGSGSSPAVTSTVSQSLDPTGTNGNNVNLDTETLTNVQTGLSYQLALRATDDQFSLLRSALRTQ
ncbi:MAG TPA: flagellar basal body protein [Dermatophilaceae bacterium]